MNNSHKAPETLKHFPLPRVVWGSLHQPPTNTHTATATQTHSFMHVVPENTLSAVLAGGCKDFTTKGRLSTALCHKEARQSDSLTQAFPEATWLRFDFKKYSFEFKTPQGSLRLSSFGWDTLIIHIMSHAAPTGLQMFILWDDARLWVKIQPLDHWMIYFSADF